MRAYLVRPVVRGPRFLDHGVLGTMIAGGLPHRYRLGLALGLLDHFTLGVTANWLPGELTPDWSPYVAVAFWRNRLFEVGAWYQKILEPTPPLDEDPETFAFRRNAHYFMTTATVSQWWVQAGFDLGLARAREADPFKISGRDNSFVIAHRLAGGLHLRAGSRRFGVTAQALWPYFCFDVMLDVRFGLFEMRSRGGWLDVAPR